MTDEAMKAKEFLDQYRDAVNIVRNLKEQAGQLEMLAEGTGIDVSKEQTRSNAVNDPTGELGAKLADIYRDIMDAAGKAVNVLMDVSRVINAVDDPNGSRVLHLRFIELLAWEEIADEMHYTQRHVHRIKDKALMDVYNDIECHD